MLIKKKEREFLRLLSSRQYLSYGNNSAYITLNYDKTRGDLNLSLRFEFQIYRYIFCPFFQLRIPLPPGPMIHSYQPGLRLACGMTHASFARLPLGIGGRSSRPSVSGRSGGTCVSTVGLHLVSSPASKCALRTTMASVCIIGSGNW